MATQTVIDLNELVPEDKRATLGDEVYNLPGDMPLDTFLRIQRAAQAENASDPEEAIQKLEGLREALADLFVLRLRQDGLGAEALAGRRERVIEDLSGFGIASLFALINTVYGEAATDEPEDAEGEDSSGTKSSSRRKTQKSAS